MNMIHYSYSYKLDIKQKLLMNWFDLKCMYKSSCL